MNMKAKRLAGIFHFWGVLGFFMLVFLGQRTDVLAAEVYEIDPAHSSLNFAVKHLTVSTVTGQFIDYSGTIQYDPAEASSFMSEVNIKASSIDTRQEKRDAHLKSADFFDVEKYPAITFKSKRLTAQGGSYAITGDLTMHGVTKEISIPVIISGPVNSPMGAKVIGLSGETTINRQDFGISWNKTLDSGGFMVSDEVKITVNIEAGNKGKK